MGNCRVGVNETRGGRAMAVKETRSRGGEKGKKESEQEVKFMMNKGRKKKKN